ncbi:protein transcription factor [Mesorhizobium sp. LSJC268A00]|nr:protein transcription factor [Mesorhizobium sp. LSJC268A00]
MIYLNLHCISSDEKSMPAVNNEEAPKPRQDHETPLETAARLRAEFGVELSKQAPEPLPRSVYDKLSAEV